jgi:hypothetical protein
MRVADPQPAGQDGDAPDPVAAQQRDEIAGAITNERAGAEEVAEFHGGMIVSRGSLTRPAREAPGARRGRTAAVDGRADREGLPDRIAASFPVPSATLAS